MNKLTLSIAGKETPFFSAKIGYSLERLAHTFEAEIPFERFDKPEKVEWRLNGKVVMSGQLDTTSTRTDSGRRGLRITGRSLAANLIDSRIKMDAQYGQSFKALVTKVAGEFGLGVVSNSEKANEVIEEFQINCESPMASLAQLAKQKNLILIERDGAILIEVPGTYQVENIALIEGENLASFEIDRNWTDLFYHYEVQGPWEEGDKAVVTYAGANPVRKRVIMADKANDGASCADRAEYEKNLAIAKGLNVKATIPGIWLELSGIALNRLVLIKSVKQSFEEKLLIKSLSISVNDKSQQTDVELFRPFAEKSDA